MTAPTQALTPAHRRVLVALADGLTDTEAAVRLGIGASTIRAHLIEIRHRLNARNRVQAVAVAVREGYL